MLYEGQLEWRRLRPPVFVARRAKEAPDLPLLEFYACLLTGIQRSELRRSAWRRLETSGWPDNQSHTQLLAWSWDAAAGGQRTLVVVNYADRPAQGIVSLPWSDLDGGAWLFRDLLASIDYRREGAALETDGLYVDLPGWVAHLFALSPV